MKFFLTLCIIVTSFSIAKAQVQEDSVVVATDSTWSKRGDVYLYAEQAPEFPGGMPELMTYMSDHILYPCIAREKDASGRIVINFIIDENGYVVSPKIAKADCSADTSPEACEALKQEALRVVSSLPPWKPGMQDGKPVKVYYNIPVKFVLGGDRPKKRSGKKEKRH